MAVLGAATLELNADTGKLEAALGRSVESAALFGTAVGTVLGQAVSRAAGYFKQLTESAIDQLDVYDKLSQKIGVSVERLSEYRVAAALAGTSDGTIKASFKSLAEHASEAARGVGKASQAFKLMGIDPGQFKTTADLFDAVLEKMSQYEDSAQRDALANATLGRSYQELAPFADALLKNKGLARELGLELDENTTQAAARFKDNMKIAELGASAMGTRIAVVLLPAMEKLSGFLVENAKNTERLDQVSRVADAGLRLMASGGAILYGVFNTVGQAIGGVAAAIGLMVRGEFKAADAALSEVGNSLGTNIAEAARGVARTWDDAGRQVEAKAEDNGKKLAAPALKGAEHVKRATNEMRDAIMTVYDNAMNGIAADEEIAKRTSAAFERQATAAAALAEAQDKLSRGELTENWGDGLGAVERKAKDVNDVARQLGMTFASAGEEAILHWQGVGNLLRGIEQDFLRIMLRKGFTEPAAAGATSFLASLGIGAATGADQGAELTAAFGGARASGGPVSAGSFYLVGEHGPELFAPGQDGSIVPNGAMKGNTYMIDARGADGAAVARIEQALLKLAGPGVVERRAVAAVAERSWR